MNADVSYNERRTNEAAILKRGIIERTEKIASILGTKWEKQVEPEPTLCEENQWLAMLMEQLDHVIRSSK